MTYFMACEEVLDKPAFLEGAKGGYYRAFVTAEALLASFQGSDDTPVALFDGNAKRDPEGGADGMVLVWPVRLLGWTTVSDLRGKVKRR